MERERGKLVGGQVILRAAVLFMVLPALIVLAAEDGGGPAPSTAPRLFFEPIEGLTTTRHFAPSQTAIPLGTVLELFLDVPEDAQVTFSGATITSRTAEGIKATCLLNQEGPAIVAAICEMSDGARYTRSCRLDVVSIAISDISATVTTPTVALFDLDENATNEETMSFYRGESIADLVETTQSVTGVVGLDGGRRRARFASVNRRFRTSIFRRINFHADVDPPAFAPVMEWRFDGLARALGAERTQTFSSVGEHTVSVGPPSRSAEIGIDTYSVSITSHKSGYDVVPEGEWITFEAVTDPPGLEEEISWLSSTKYGTASPVIGHGLTFTVEFTDTFGIDDGFQWLGVRADNAVFNQDTKSACCIGTDETCQLLTSDECSAASGVFNPGKSCAEANCTNRCIYEITNPNGVTACVGGLCVDEPTPICPKAGQEGTRLWKGACDPPNVMCNEGSKKYQCTPSAGQQGCCCEVSFTFLSCAPSGVFNEIEDSSASCP